MLDAAVKARAIHSLHSLTWRFKWTTNVWNVQAVPQLYGLSLSGVSNIILTQGALDPWSGGGYQPGSPSANQDQGIYVMEIPGSAHHLDLRTPNTCDPNTIKNARYQMYDKPHEYDRALGLEC
ncbi:hypothetical protein ANCCEY_08347 [Ancylostoma ceylanicum]|uniref:Serine carboxypeptidase S28 n=1 Tax=Ancylostoma ceylanicum TaxID=53326 RepID=A0A0D6LKI7_9BILA|nr:hypothetical protein ANCCEY_08347 [Ancylostoma ceylanicum]